MDMVMNSTNPSNSYCQSTGSFSEKQCFSTLTHLRRDTAVYLPVKISRIGDAGTHSESSLQQVNQPLIVLTNFCLH